MCTLESVEVSFKNRKDITFKTKYIGNAFVTDSKLIYFRDNLDIGELQG